MEKPGEDPVSYESWIEGRGLIKVCPRCLGLLVVRVLDDQDGHPIYQNDARRDHVCRRWGPTPRWKAALLTLGVVLWGLLPFPSLNDLIAIRRWWRRK